VLRPYCSTAATYPLGREDNDERGASMRQWDADDRRGNNAVISTNS